MGVDVEVHMNPEFGADHIVDHLRSVGAEGVTMRLGIDHCPDYFIITFKWGDEDRVMNFHYRSGVFKSNLVTLGLWGSAGQILERIAQKFGGVFVPNDCENAAVMYDQAEYNTGNGLFVHKWGIAHGHISDSRVEDIVEAGKVFKEKIG